MDLQEIIKNMLTKENVTFVIAVSSFGLSMFNFFKGIIENRVKVKMNYRACKIANTSKRNLAYFQISFENRSRLPISISRMFLIYDKEKYEFNWLPERILDKQHIKNKVIAEEKNFYSEQIPHTIEALGIWGGFFFLNFPNEVEESDFAQKCKKIRIYTNRGIKSFKLKISPANINPPNFYF